MPKRISILGSTGSIGVNTLKIVSQLQEDIDVFYLSCNKNASLLIEQAIQFNVKAVCIVDKNYVSQVQHALESYDIEVLEGRDGLLELSERNNVDILLNGLVGASGMEPTLRAIEAGINVALSNKESLVMAGKIIKRAMEISKAKLFPVDSEHSAIWQCLVGENIEDVRRLIITGSGGPFLRRDMETFHEVTIQEALNHPNWDMGNKISIDSATMMNKGFEVIEAFWLFGFKSEFIDIIIHPQSIIHSMIEFKDASIKAQLGIPDMKVPIQYALTYPRHIDTPWEKLDFFSCQDFTFEEPDFERFPCMRLAFESLEKDGTASAVLNLSNDYAVARFLNDEIKFTDIPLINESSIHLHEWVQNPTLDDLKLLDDWVKNHVSSY
tara:strand:+ start:3051 stop:4196 length:1146 start_codon:yes stop_codon:yes gene_type:complete